MNIKPFELPLALALTLTPESKALLQALGNLNQQPTGATPASATAAAALTTPAIGEHWSGQGGIYGGLRPAILGMPAAHMVWSEKEWEDLPWGERGRSIIDTTSRVDGQANTRALLAAGNCPAAQAAANHRHDELADYFLPSQFDLFIASLQAGWLFKKEGWYWSSTQGSAITAFAQDFEHGGSDWITKGHRFRVRALRLIQL
jgi:hypothetical protein